MTYLSIPTITHEAKSTMQQMLTEPQKKAEVCEHKRDFESPASICKLCGVKYIDEWVGEPQQEDKNIEPINIKFVEGGELRSPISRTDMCNKINEIIDHINTH